MFTPKTANTATKGNTTPSVFKPKSGSDLFVQPKLKVGQPGDKYETEADHVADQVVNKQQHGTQSNISSSPIAVQTKTEDETIQEKPIAERIQPISNLSDAAPVQRMEEEEPVQKQEDEEVQKQEDEEVQAMSEDEEVQKQEDEEVQTMSEDEEVQKQEDEELQTKKSIGTVAKSKSKNIDASLKNSRGKGSPLPSGIKSKMESGFGADFGGVKIHTGSESVAMNKKLGAQAFTNKNDIFFNEGKFNPTTKKGETLLAHELTHTIQQGASGPATQESTAAGGGGTGATASETPVADPTQSVSVDGAAAPGKEPVATDAKKKDFVKGEKGEGETAVEAEPTTPRSPEDDPNFKKLKKRVSSTAKKQQAHEPSSASASSAQAAAVPPSNEQQGKAQEGVVDNMDQQEAGDFSADAFKAKLKERIDSMQLPKNEEEAEDFENNNNIDEVRQVATNDVQQEKSGASGAIETATAKEPKPGDIPKRETTPLPPAPIGNAPASARANQAMPPKRGEGEVSKPLQDNMGEVNKEMADNEVTDDQLANSNQPEFIGALGSKNTAETHTNEAPTQFRAEEQGTLQNAQASAESSSQQKLGGMHQGRAGLLNQVTGQQQQTGTSDTKERERISNDINTIYTAAKTDVEKILSDLDTKVSDLFTKGAEAAKKAFEDHVDKEMDDYLDERYGGVGGFFNRVGDVFTGLPDEVNKFFTRGREVFIEKMDGVITEISTVVATELNAAKQRITKGKQEVQNYVLTLDTNLQQLGKDAAEGIQEKFDDLEQSVDDKQDELIDSLANKYNESLEAVDARIEEMKAANRGLIDMALDAVVGVIKTILKIKNMLMNLLSSALEIIGTIVKDPIGFLGMLIKGVGQGLKNFVGNIGQHLQSGLIGWLTGSLGPIGIQIPDDLFSLSGIFNLVAQILGITWDFVRRKAVKLLGEPVVKVVETGVEIFQVIRRDGAAGLWEYIKEEFNNLKETVIDAIKEMVITKVIEAGIKWMLGLLSPAGAFVKAAMMIIDIVKFFIERGSQIIEMVRAFIEGVKAIASGNVSKVSEAIENALKMALPVVIGFLASLLGITGLTQKVQKIIKKIRKKIDKAITKMILKVKKTFKNLLRKGKAKVKGVVAGLFEWWKKKKKFKNKGGENHTLSFKGKADKAELYIASTPKPVKQYLNDLKNDPNSDKTALAEAKRILDSKLKIIIKGSKKAGPEREEKQKMIDVTDALNQISAALMKLSGNPTKPANAVYSFGSAKPTNVSVEKLHDGSQNKNGSKPKTGANTGTTGWRKIHQEGLSKQSDKWVQMHLINRLFGGPGSPENLVPGPNSINKGAKQERFDKSVKRILKQGGKSSGAITDSVIWITANVSYRSGTVKDKAGNDVDLGDYANQLQLESGLHVPQGTNWDQKSGSKIKTTITIPKPNFTKKDKISLNNSTGTNMRESGIDVFDSSKTSYANSLISFIKRERPFGSYGDFQTRLGVFARKGNSLIPLSSVSSIRNKLEANKDIKL